MTAPELFRAAPCSSRYQVVGPIRRGKDVVVGTVARVETGDEAQDQAMAHRIAAALNYVDGIETVTLEDASRRRPS